MTKGQRYDFQRTCVDKKTAEHVRSAVIKEYENNPKWTIGESKIEELSSGEYKVTVELSFKEYEQKEGNGMRM